VPPTVKDLIERLEQAGFANRGGKGSHRNFVHPKVIKPTSVSGKPGDDAKQYLAKAVEKAITESRK
jgi:predicted RNA binding protein YcfA (HicA-like mRNA interferase family)